LELIFSIGLLALAWALTLTLFRWLRRKPASGGRQEHRVAEEGAYNGGSGPQRGAVPDAAVTPTSMRYTVVLIPTEYEHEAAYTVRVPALPGCITEGDSVEEALANAKEAIEGHLLSLRRRGLSIPQETGKYAYEVEVSVGS
jgi:antitoxin HicB